MGFLALLGRVNAAHPWSHNDAFAGFVLRQARAVRRGGGGAALDVGCGTGTLLKRLSGVFPTVIGIEPDAAAAAVAAERCRTSAVRVENRGFGHERPAAYDLIVFVASLHHLALRDALEEARAAVRPGGRVVIVGLARETQADALRSAVSLLLNPLIGLARHPARATRRSAHVHAPTADPAETFEEVRDVVRRVLPGIRLRRRLFWRYTASWSAPRDRSATRDPQSQSRARSAAARAAEA
ncbi:class I SAM-dependent methyltransferase [Leifsonia shinshuensis]|uniref:class I SAM-dependent methyltransferase n=1 Tax=Leifsonia shinshuensis TaxID=150026 RepID=UPI001F50CCF5|nr:class I SAM-dependent methyltransferase [Leifsonia shinshuensis]MCI0156173.1 class I SAM-dependent methyltransferase [Leifsonia shinshuensis]